MEDVCTCCVPELPRVPRLTFCLHFPGTVEWKLHWLTFNRLVKEFHSEMIDFNWSILEWYSTKKKQLEKFGKTTKYMAGKIVSYGQTSIIFAETRSNSFEVMKEVRRSLPEEVRNTLRDMESSGFRLTLVGKTFIFSDEMVVIIDTDARLEYLDARNCMKYELFIKNERVNVLEAYSRVYSGIKMSFAIGAIGGLILAYSMGNFSSPQTRARHTPTTFNLCWIALKRAAQSGILYTVAERYLLLRFSKPQKYMLSGSAGVICGSLLGVCNTKKSFDSIVGSGAAFGAYAFLINAFYDRKYYKSVGE